MTTDRMEVQDLHMNTPRREVLSNIAALSADLRESVDSEDSEYHDTLAQLLDAIDEFLSSLEEA